MVVEQDGDREEMPADAVLLLTGYRRGPDADASAGVEIDPRRAARLRPETFETNVPRLFIAGGEVAGVPERHDLHRERPLPRREGDRSDY